MELNLEQKLHILLTPEMQHSLKILQMNNLELTQYIQELALENPTMEAENPKEETPDSIFDKIEWLDSLDENRYKEYRGYSNKEDTVFDIPEPCGETLEECLILQLIRYNLTKSQQKIAERIICSLDENGYLTESIDEIAETIHVHASSVEKILGLIQHFEPSGVGARNLHECLQIQLETLGEKGSTAYLIVQKHLENLSFNRIRDIAECLQVSVNEVVKAREIILTLDPKPGRNFTKASTQYIFADVIVIKTEDGFIPYINDSRVPIIKISSYYKRLSKNTYDTKVKEYLGEKIRQSSWVVRCIQQRNHTILQSTKALIDLQRRFFNNGPHWLVPMRLADIAQRVNLHVSTISRAFRGKYLQCSWGLFPFGFFLSKGVGNTRTGNLSSPRSVKARIKDIIDNENKRDPISDHSIAVKLKDLDIEVSRRTVAKYRGELNIPSSLQRKEF